MNEREKALEAALQPFADAWPTVQASIKAHGLSEEATTGWRIKAKHIRAAVEALALPATVDRASWEAGRDAAAVKLSSMCPKCGGEGWLWGHELVEPPDVEGHDDTRYSCDSEVHEYAAAIRSLTPPQEDTP